MERWAVECKSEADFLRVVLICDSLGIPVLELSRELGYDRSMPYLVNGSKTEFSVMRCRKIYIDEVQPKLIEPIDIYEYLLEWKEKCS